MTIGKRGLASRSMEALFRSGTACGLDDSHLLERFLDRGPGAEDAFEALVLRHGPMVFDVCRNILGRSHDAEDAFQATFLILASRAASVRRKSSVASWLYGVALRTASRLKQDAARRRLKEQSAAEWKSEKVEGEKEPTDFRRLHEEVGRLPSRYRDPIILCYFEGMTQEMAATQLGCPAATVGVRLMRAKARLKDRLGCRGELIAPAVLLNPVSGSLARSTVRSAVQFTEAGPVSLAVAQLTREVSKAMFMMKLKAAAAVLLVAGSVAAVGFVTHLALAEDLQPKPAASEIEAKTKPTKPKSDLEEFQGTWATKVERNYTRNFVLQPAELVTEKWVISGDTIRTYPRLTETQADMFREATSTINLDPLEERTFLMKLDLTKTPRTIDLTMPGRVSYEGIYELDGDTLRICWGFRERPTAFLHEPKNNSTLFTLKRLSRTPEEMAPRFAITPGCYWAVYPSQVGRPSTASSLAVLSDFDSGRLTVHIARPSEKYDDGPYRPVAFDVDRKRYDLNQDGGAGTRGAGDNDRNMIFLNKYRLDKNVLGGKKITHVGVELVTPEALKRGKVDEPEPITIEVKAIEKD